MYCAGCFYYHKLKSGNKYIDSSLINEYGSFEWIPFIMLSFYKVILVIFLVKAQLYVHFYLFYSYMCIYSMTFYEGNPVCRNFVPQIRCIGGIQ